MVQSVFSDTLIEAQNETNKALKTKDHNETAEYILLYGKFESALDKMGPCVEYLLTTEEFTFGQKGDLKNRTAYLQQWQQLYKSLVDSYLKSREPVGPVVLKNLKRFETSEPKPEADFKLFARRCVNYVFDICHNELKLVEKFFHDGPLLAIYTKSASWDIYGNYTERLEQSRMGNVTTLYNFLTPYMGSGDLHRVCDLVNWLETRYMIPPEGNEDDDEIHRASAHVLLHDHLWPFSDALFIKAATELEHFKPLPKDLLLTKRSVELSTQENLDSVSAAGPSVPGQVSDGSEMSEAVGSGVWPAYPTVKTAVELLIMYNDSMYDRPVSHNMCPFTASSVDVNCFASLQKKGDVLYEIVHQTTESLQRAATIIMRSSGMLEAQVFLIRNLMLIENLFMTHEIPDSIRQSAELDFSPIWDTIKELQIRRQVFNPLAYITPLVRGQLLPAVVDHLLDARKELEKVLVQQITSFTKHWQGKLGTNQNKDAVGKAIDELNALLDRAFEEETTRAALWRMIQSDEL